MGAGEGGEFACRQSRCWRRSPRTQSLSAVVAAISSTITSWLTSGRPRQFIEIALNSRCAGLSAVG
jgi:hypothetical protein